MKNLFNLFSNKCPRVVQGLIDYGHNKKDGSHNHKFNIGADRTPAQKVGDAKKSKK